MYVCMYILAPLPPSPSTHRLTYGKYKPDRPLKLPTHIHITQHAHKRAYTTGLDFSY